MYEYAAPLIPKCIDCERELLIFVSHVISVTAAIEMSREWAKRRKEERKLLCLLEIIYKNDIH